MAAKLTTKSFAQEIRSLGIKTILFPLLAIFLIVLIIIVVGFFVTMRSSLIANTQDASEKLESIVGTYIDKSKELTTEFTIDDCTTSVFATTVYDFINTQDLRAQFFVLDKQDNVLMASTTIISDYLQKDDSHFAGLLHSLRLNPDEAIIRLNKVGTARSYITVLSIARAIVEKSEVVGYIVFEFTPDEMANLVAKENYFDVVVTNVYFTNVFSTRSYLLDENEKIKPEFRVKDTSRVNLDSFTYFVSSKYLANFGLWIYCIAEIGFALWLFQVCTAFSLLFIVIGGVFTILATNKAVNVQAGSIDSMLKHLEEMKAVGVYSKLEPVQSEFKSLEVSYNQMIDSIQSLMKSKDQEVQMRHLAETRQLQTQFSTHFLFNTLELIRCYIRVDAKACNQMILDFSSLLRYSIDASKEFVILKDDLTYIDRYLSLNKIRLEDKLVYNIDIQTEAESAIIPKLVVQPLVENALKYSKSKVTEINIKAAVKGSILNIEVENMGEVIPADKLEDIRETLEKEETPSKYFGLYSIHRRLRLTYGSASGLHLESQNGKTIVSIVICLGGK